MLLQKYHTFTMLIVVSSNTDNQLTENQFYTGSIEDNSWSLLHSTLYLHCFWSVPFGFAHYPML